MRDSEPMPPAPGGEGLRLFYVINLCAAPVPLALEVPGTSGLDGLVVFRSHQVQDGRHRYRLHLGYFDTREAAERVLPRVLPRFPTAWIATAPKAHLGSLDDTGATDFKLIQAPSVARPGFSVAEPALPPAGEPPTAAAPEEEAQRYAVQLVWTSDRMDPADLPPIALFDAYTLYTVTCQRGGVRLYGVRLGFFRSAISASQVAVYVRPDFPSVAVVPVSDREFAYASWLVRHRGPTPETAQAPAPAPATALATARTAPPAAPAQASSLSGPTATPQATSRAPRSATARARAPQTPAPAAQAQTPAARAQTPAAREQQMATARAAQVSSPLQVHEEGDEVPWTSAPAPELRTPTQVEIAQIRSPDEIPLIPADPPNASQTERHTAPARQPSRRVPAPDREARLAALGAHEVKLRGTKTEAPGERRITLNDMRPSRSKSFPDERSALARLISRFTDRAR